MSPIATVSHDGHDYPAFTASGHASRFAAPFAAEVCKGFGFDVGCGRAEWALPGSVPIDPNVFTPNTPTPGGGVIRSWNYSARCLPGLTCKLDYIFSSHCLEHLDDWVGVLEYWRLSYLAPGGVLFLYLPHYDQTYWRPWNNRKHKNIFTPEIISDYMVGAGYKNVFASGRDLNY